MSSETSSTARVSPPARLPNMDSARGKTLVRWRTSTRAMAGHVSKMSGGDQRHRGEGGQHTGKLPARETLVQKKAGEQHGNGGIKGAYYYRDIQASHLTGADEESRAGDIHEAGEDAKGGSPGVEFN